MGTRNLVTSQSSCEIARWKHALSELIKNDLIENAGYKQEVFHVTDLGYKFVDVMRPQ